MSAEPRHSCSRITGTGLGTAKRITFEMNLQVVDGRDAERLQVRLLDVLRQLVDLQAQRPQLGVGVDELVGQTAILVHEAPLLLSGLLELGLDARQLRVQLRGEPLLGLGEIRPETPVRRHANNGTGLTLRRTRRLLRGFAYRTVGRHWSSRESRRVTSVRHLASSSASSRPSPRTRCHSSSTSSRSVSWAKCGKKLIRARVESIGARVTGPAATPFTCDSWARQRSSSWVNSRLSASRSSSNRRRSRSSHSSSSCSSRTSRSCCSSSVPRCRFTCWMSCACTGSLGGLGVLALPSPTSYCTTSQSLNVQFKGKRPF